MSIYVHIDSMTLERFRRGKKKSDFLRCIFRQMRALYAPQNSEAKKEPRGNVMVELCCSQCNQRMKSSSKSCLPESGFGNFGSSSWLSRYAYFSGCVPEDLRFSAVRAVFIVDLGTSRRSLGSLTVPTYLCAALLGGARFVQ